MMGFEPERASEEKFRNLRAEKEEQRRLLLEHENKIKENERTDYRMEKINLAIDGLTIDELKYDDILVRQLISQISVIDKEMIRIIFYTGEIVEEPLEEGNGYIDK